MRTLMLALFTVVILTVVSCIKDDNTSFTCVPPDVTAPAGEVTVLKAYLDSNHITAKQDSHGFFYTIDSSASTVATHPTACSYVTIAYTGKLTNGLVFDTATTQKPYYNNLANLVYGIHESIPFMKLNSTMNLYLPPSLGYGNFVNGLIPANSILIFNVTLVGFN